MTQQRCPFPLLQHSRPALLPKGPAAAAAAGVCTPQSICTNLVGAQLVKECLDGSWPVAYGERLAAGLQGCLAGGSGAGSRSR
jgi:hypothetical protein